MNEAIWEPYRTLLGAETIEQLVQIASLLKGAKIVHVNSTRVGGGVAEILNKMVPLMQGLGLDTHWEVVEGNKEFFECTKMLHNLFQGKGYALPSSALLRNFEAVNAKNSEKLAPLLQEADFVMIHDPQPLPLISHFPKRKGKWIWRCHIDTSSTPRFLWKYLRKFINLFDASVFSLEGVNQLLPHPIYIIPPSIDPFSEKNIDLDEQEVAAVLKQFNIDPKRRIALQISRFDIFKDPVGVIQAYKLAKKYNPDLQLILAGGGATDDPEGEAVLREVQEAAQGDPDIHVIDLPPAPRVINALQRGADIVLQKSIKEGFGLTVTEALWKMKPVIGGNAGGIRIQIFNHYTGLLANTPEGAANCLRFLLQDMEKGRDFGVAGKRLVKENFLITRHLREYLTMMATLAKPQNERIDLSAKPEPLSEQEGKKAG